jgi:PhnB protein
MGAVIHPYLRFGGSAKEAFTFYQECLGGELNLTTVGESPMASFLPDKAEQVFHVQLKSGDIVLLGSDMVGEEGLQHGNTMVAALDCSSKDEAKRLFDALSADGVIGHPITEQPWGTIGDFKDRFGVDWFVTAVA